ncbi:MAG: type II toxin-antitoxin system RelE/ParE family toxin [Alphaproteobacteria bacterium]|nr:type II toxin-antitoxin system RelE/ParE family toxin [Alphaproteobacteria bacterium]
MKKIQFTNAAKQDLKSIFTYTIRKWGVTQAKRYSDQLHSHIQKIASSVVFSKQVQNSDRDLQQSATGRHLVIFEQADDHILIVRILHEAMDVPRHIGS